MNRELRRRVVQFLERHIGETASERKAVLESALHGCSVIQEVGDRDKSPYVFSSNMVDTLETHGRCAGDDEPALVVLLRYIGTQKGHDVRQEADALCDDLLRDTDSSTTPSSTSKVQIAELGPDTIIAGRYRLLQSIGDKSGQATVWKAQDLNDPELPPVVIKCVKPHATRDYASRFLEEVRSVRELDEHPNIVPIYDYGIDHGLRYLVMPLMRESLRSLMDRTGSLPSHEAMNYLKQVADALDHAHEHGILHRDLKPANMLFTRETGRLCLADFGISYRPHRQGAITGKGETVATKEYAAPEQLRSNGEVTRKSDIYALAINAYELLVGALPFEGTETEISEQHDLGLPDPVNSQLPPFVLQVLRMGAAKDAALRPEKATDFVRHLQEAIDGKAPEVIEHYLNEVLPAHLREVMPKEVFAGLKKAFVDPIAEIRQQEDRRISEVDEIDWDLFPPEVIEDNQPDSSLQIELGGELHPPREGNYSDEVEYTGNVRERVQSLRRVVLLGEPGAGKTFMLGRLALDYAEKCRKNPDAVLPVFIPLSRYDTEETFDVFAAQRMGTLSDRLSRPGIVWLLDALNEMPDDKGQWRHLKDFINGLIKTDSPFILTCRVKNYNEYLHDVEGLYRVDLQDLNPQQIYDILTHFLKERYASQIWNTVMLGSGDLLAAWRTWKGSVREFWEKPEDYLWPWDVHEAARVRIHNDPRKLMLLCRNPFTLVRLLIMRMGKAVGKCGGDLAQLDLQLEEELPGNRARLFGAVIGDMLQAEAIRQKWIETDIHAVEAVLEICAAAMQTQQQRTEMPLQDLLEAENVPADGLTRLKMARDAGLIMLSESVVRFNHQLFQEYFATKRLREVLDDYSERFPAWEDGDPLPPRDERLGELFPQWWIVGGWRVTVALLGELEKVGINRVVRWLASHTPEIALNMVLDNNDGLRVQDLSEAARSAVVDGANNRTTEPSPIGRAAAYRVLGHPDIDADKRPGIGVIIHDGVSLPDIDWVHIPAGEFTIGHEDERDNPPRVLTLDYDFYIARYPLTHAQFKTFIDDHEGYRDTNRWFDGLAAHEGDKKMGKQYFKYANHPRECVNWYQAIAFCRWLSWRLGGGYALDAIDEWAVRLPTEFEWEKEARGTTGLKYPWGDDYHEGCANIIETRENAGKHRLGRSSPVGIYPHGDTPHWSKPISDLSGNVWEWCLTDYDNPQVKAGQENISSAARRVLRGGSWRYDLDFARAVCRGRHYPSYRSSDNGFRLLRARG